MWKTHGLPAEHDLQMVGFAHLYQFTGGCVYCIPIYSTIRTGEGSEPAYFAYASMHQVFTPKIKVWTDPSSKSKSETLPFTLTR